MYTYVVLEVCRVELTGWFAHYLYVQYIYVHVDNFLVNTIMSSVLLLQSNHDDVCCCAAAASICDSGIIPSSLVGR